ncbi:hypothetical protein KEM55_001654 [Ascosphaera atra]|nr:hypothetical protein KEM55_001654 [Ascosphaera atra]
MTSCAATDRDESPTKPRRCSDSASRPWFRYQHWFQAAVLKQWLSCSAQQQQQDSATFQHVQE